MATFLVSTARGSVHSLAWQGFTPAECHGQLIALLAATFSEAQAASLFFAQPIFDAERETIDWYTEAQGTAQTLASLSPSEQDSLRVRVGELGTSLLAHAQKLQAESGSPQRELGGHLLELALRYPDDTCLYLVGEHPVITCWGFGPSTAGAQPQDISRRTEPLVSAVPEAVTPTKAPEQQDPPQRSIGLGWLWLLPLLLLLLLATFLITSWCGRPPLISLPGVALRGPDIFCPSVPPELATERQRELELIALLDDLQSKAKLCTKTPGFVAPAPPLISPEPEAEKKALVIPENAAKDGDLSFLAGVWECATGLSEATTSTPITVLYTFDDKGSGYVAINSPTKGLCTGKATAGIDADGLLTIETGGHIVCPSGNPFSGQRVQCRDNASASAESDKNGQAQCSGYNLSASGGEWNAVFLRR